MAARALFGTPAASRKRAWLARLGAGALPIAIGLAAALSAPSGPAGAQPAASAARPASKFDKAREHMDRGQELYLQRRYAEAGDEFAAAHAAQPFAAFLFNEAVCREKTGETGRAISLFRAYLAADPNTPDAASVRARIAKLEALGTADAGAPEGGDAGDAGPGEGGAEAGAADAGAAGGEPLESMKSLVLVESEPPGAPVALWHRLDPHAGPFRSSSPDNPGWTKISRGATPLSLTLAVGRYHVVVEPFRDFRPSETVIDVAAGHVHQFKANLAQGEFMAYLRVTAVRRGGVVYLDDPPPHKKPAWGVVPYGELVPAGEHEVFIEQTGFDPYRVKVKLEHGEQKELVADMQRAPVGRAVLDGNVPEIAIVVDGETGRVYRQTSGPVDIELPAGKHAVRATAADRKTFEGTIEVPRGRAVDVHLVMVPKFPRGGAWTEAVVGAVFVGTGTFLGIQSNRTFSDLDKDRKAGALSTDDDRYKKGKIYAIAADGCFAVGGVLGLLATYNFVRDPYPPSAAQVDPPREIDEPRRPGPVPPPQPAARAGAFPRGVSLAPAIAPGGGVLVIGGTF